MTVQEIIIKHHLNKAYLASKIQMQRGTFNNKLSANHTTQFTPQELIQLRDIIIEMGVDIDTVEAVPFDETMKQVFK